MNKHCLQICKLSTSACLYVLFSNAANCSFIISCVLFHETLSDKVWSSLTQADCLIPQSEVIWRSAWRLLYHISDLRRMRVHAHGVVSQSIGISVVRYFRYGAGLDGGFHGLMDPDRVCISTVEVRSRSYCNRQPEISNQNASVSGNIL